MNKDLRLSSLLHALLILVLLTLPVSKGDGEVAEGQAAKQSGREDESYDVEIVPPPSDRPEVTDEGEELEALKRRAPHAGDKCEQYYGGIGIQESIGSGVTDVYPGYPAHRAGIQVGDEILGGEPIRGEIGTPVTVTVMRGLRRITFELIRDKICIA